MTSASTDTLTKFWLGLPEELRAKLLLGFTGKRHLLNIAGWCLRTGDQKLVPIAADAILTAFGENPLDGEMTGELLSHAPIRAILPTSSITAMTAVAEAWRKPDNTGYFERLLRLRDMGKLKLFLEQSIAKEPNNLFWSQQAVTFGLIDNDPDWVESMVLQQESEGLRPVINNVAALIRSFRGQSFDAARVCQNMDDTFGPVFSCLRAGLCMTNEGDPASAHLLLAQSLGSTPWSTSLVLRLHDILSGRESEVRPLTGSTAVLLYTWNKDIEIDATLHSLFESDLTAASIFVLDNGSTDTTPTVLESWKARFDNLLGQGRFEIITLPVNIGAPAARNWLMHHPAVTEHDFVCYLDDDVALPPDWLLRLGTAVHHYPEAGVWGCKVVDDANPALIQSADSHLIVAPDGHPLDLTQTAPNPFRLTDLHIQTLDSGLFNMLRPCASVTGCCHLFRTATLLDSGDFAIHLSPTQYDDMEHDLRLCSAGRFAVYQGHLTVRHKKNTGTASHTSMQEEGNALGNKYKMQTMHAHSEMVDAMYSEQALLEKDLLDKMALIENA